MNIKRYTRILGYADRRTDLSLATSIFLITISLFGCGGGGGSSSTPASDDDPIPDDGNTEVIRYSVGGTISGNGGDVTLSLNGTEETFNTNSFTFTRSMGEDEGYLVQFISTSTDQVCTVTNASGTARANVTNVTITCSSPVELISYHDALLSGAMGIGDFNGDTHPDIVIAIRTNEFHTNGRDQFMLRFIYGDGGGEFDNYFDVPLSEPGHTVRAADYNGDGLDDVFVDTRDAFLIINGRADGQPVLHSSTSFSPGFNVMNGEIDENGTTDLIGISFDRQFYFNSFLNPGNGEFNEPHLFVAFNDAELRALTYFDPYSLSIGDFNNDGHLDICTVSGFGEPIEFLAALGVFYGDGNGNFENPSVLTQISKDIYNDGLPDGIQYKRMAAGDVDGDGDDDLILSSNLNFVEVHINNGDRTFTVNQRVIVGTDPIFVALADFNLDGKLDIYSANNASQTGVLNFGHGDGTFGDSTNELTSWRSVQYPNYVDMDDLVTTDLNHDGYPDILISSHGYNRLSNHSGSIHISYGIGK